MSGLRKRPYFRSREEAVAYDQTPKWLLWEAAYHLAAAKAESYDEAMDNGEGFKLLTEEVDIHRNRNNERKH